MQTSTYILLFHYTVLLQPEWSYHGPTARQVEVVVFIAALLAFAVSMARVSANADARTEEGFTRNMLSHGVIIDISDEVGRPSWLVSISPATTGTGDVATAPSRSIREFVFHDVTVVHLLIARIEESASKADSMMQALREAKTTTIPAFRLTDDVRSILEC